MINGRRLKVCGITTVADADFAVQSGADYLGFNFVAASPRVITFERYREIADRKLKVGSVAVVAEPTVEELEDLNEEGFDIFQIHFRPDAPLARVKTWRRVVGAEKLWLAPKLPPGTELPSEVLADASTFLIDGFQADKFGGTGRLSDWTLFGRLSQEHPGKTWILSGGLSPENVARALAATGAKMIDVNSGVESAPGQKDRAKISALVATMAAANS